MRMIAAYALAVASVAVLTSSPSEAQQAIGQLQTPSVPFYPNQLQAGTTPFISLPARSGVTTFGSSGLTSGVTSINTNPLAEGTPVKGQAFSQGGLSTVPGGDTFTQSTNASNVTSSTSGLGYSDNRR